jgi:hypothetical protein
MIYVSSSSINSNSIESSINELIKLNIRNIELSGGTNYSENIASTLIKSMLSLLVLSLMLAIFKTKSSCGGGK